MTAAHDAAVLALLRTASEIDTHLVGEVPDGAPMPYRVLTPPGGHTVDGDLEAATRDFDDTYRVTCTGANLASARMVQADTLARLHDAPLVLDGAVGHIERTSTTPFAADKSLKRTATNTHPVYVVDFYKVTSTPTR